jgi:hypothetical protein
MENYLKNGFFIDLIACFPFSLIFSSQESEYTGLLRLLRLSRLARLIRIAKLLKLIKHCRS